MLFYFSRKELEIYCQALCLSKGLKLGICGQAKAVLVKRSQLGLIEFDFSVVLIG